MIFKGRYKLLSEFQNANSGNARWSFVLDEVTGKEYFIKEFLSPRFPLPDAPGSKKVIERKKQRCLDFEKRQIHLKDTIFSKTASGGNLITTIDFFRVDSKYYKISEKVVISHLSIEEVSKLKLEEKMLLMKTVAHSLKILHNLNILHADLKPDNVLIKTTDKGLHTTKLIDFDDSFFMDDIPKSIDDIVGTMLYYSPEIATAMEKDDTSILTLKSDIYTLGLIYCQYLTGELPSYNLKKYDYPWEASLESEENINVNDKDLPIGLKEILNNMLLTNANDRINITEVHSNLKKVSLKEDSSESSKTPITKKSLLKVKTIEPKKETMTSSSLKGTLLDKKKTIGSKLKGTLLPKKSKLGRK